MKAKKEKRFHSILFKNMVIIALAGLLLIIIFSVFYPGLFYKMAKKELIENTRESVHDTAIRISYILSRHRETLDLRSDENVLTMLEQYYADTKTRPEIYKELSSYVSHASSKYSSNDFSSQASRPSFYFEKNYSLIATSEGDYFYNESLAPLVEQFVQSDILSSIYQDDNGKFFSDSFFIDKHGNAYTPILHFTLEGQSFDFMCTIGAFHLNGVNCYAVSLMPFEGINILRSLTNVDMPDFILSCGGYTLFQNQENSVLPSICAKKTNLSNVQYETEVDQYEGGIRFYVLCSYPSERLYMAVDVTKEELITPYQKFFHTLRLLFVLVILFMILLCSFIYIPSIKRLHHLKKQMQQINTGNFDVRLIDDKPDEIGSITQTIQMMLNNLKTNMEEIIASEKMEKDLQYSLLVSAIDPHYIYNTLDTVTFLASMGKYQDIIQVNNALICTLKDRLKMKQLNIYDSVAKEQKVVEQYMIIMSYLYSNPINFQFFVSDEDSTLQIPKNIIQPLVENSIKHGLMPNKDASRSYTKSGQILVQVKRMQDKIHLIVKDNGVGMSLELRNQYLGKFNMKEIDPEHIGLLNMRLRLSYLYQNNYDFQILCPDEGGTTIQLVFPFASI